MRTEWVLLGYFAKRRTPVPAGYDLGAAVEVASVSNCIAQGPPDWIDRWEHNDAFFYDSPAKARAVISADDAAEYIVYAYRSTQTFEVNASPEPYVINVAPEPMPVSFERIGYDVVSRDRSATFECSALSCSGLAREVAVNRYCLLDSFDAATELAKRCDVEQPEPGEYYVIEVWREPVNVPARAS